MARLRVARGVLGLTGTDSSSPFDNLPDREYQVLWYLGHGYSVREIAEHLRVSVPTVETYCSRLKDKLDCADHADLLKCAIQWAHSNPVA
jgi:DNA-binding NarL/FixJ family response regulator